MKTSITDTKPTTISFKVEADQAELKSLKSATLNKSRTSVKVPGFRPGKAPEEMVEKHLDPARLQSDFLNNAINLLYSRAVDELKLKAINEPNIQITKFVPFSTLEFSASVETIGKVKLGDYKHFKLKQQKLEVTKDQIDKTIEELRLRAAKYASVERAAKDGDQVEIDFKGSDAKTKQALPQATGLDYKLVLGSNSFIPGFEDKLIGTKADQEVKFDITFPSDYHDKAFKSRKVSFKVTIKSVSSVELPKLDDKFAASLGPFKTLADFKTELRRQLKEENDRQSLRLFEDAILNKLAETTVVQVPDSLIESELTKLEADAKQNAVYRGQSWNEFLASIDKDEASYRQELRPLAELRIKGGLAIGEISSVEAIDITQPELDERLAKLREEYPDPKMQQELEDPNNRREILMRLLSEKVLDYLKSEIVKNNK